MATADAKGIVNQAVFARPHCMDDGTVSFIMPNRLTRKNLQENPHAAYLFMEKGPGYKGKRLYLTKVRESKTRSCSTRCAAALTRLRKKNRKGPDSWYSSG